jgi:hypothetical protein
MTSDRVTSEALHRERRGFAGLAGAGKIARRSSSTRAVETANE